MVGEGAVLVLRCWTSGLAVAEFVPVPRRDYLCGPAPYEITPLVFECEIPHLARLPILPQEQKARAKYHHPLLPTLTVVQWFMMGHLRLSTSLFPETQRASTLHLVVSLANGGSSILNVVCF